MTQNPLSYNLKKNKIKKKMFSCEMCSIEGNNDACRNCGIVVRVRKAVEMLSDVSLFNNFQPRSFSRVSDMLLSHGVWSVPVVPRDLQNTMNSSVKHVVHVFAARNNITRPYASLFNFLTSSLPVWQYFHQFVNSSRLDTHYFFNACRASDFILTSRVTDVAHDNCVQEVSETDNTLDPIIGILHDLALKGGDMNFSRSFTNVTRGSAISCMQDIANTYETTSDYLKRFFQTASPYNFPFVTSVNGICTLKAYRVTYDASNANVPAFLTRQEIGLLSHFVSLSYTTLSEDLQDAYVHAIKYSGDSYSRECLILKQIVPAVLKYIIDAKHYLYQLETIARQEIDSSNGSNDTCFKRIDNASRITFQRGDRIIKLTSVVASIGTSGAGTKLIETAKTIATRCGAWLVLEAITWPLLPFRFYFQQGFNFVAPRNLTTSSRVEKWNEGTFWMAWKPPCVIRTSPKDYDKTWTSRELSMSKLEHSNGELFVDSVGSYSSFMERLKTVSKEQSIPTVISRPSRFNNTISSLFDASFLAYRRRSISGFLQNFTMAACSNLNINHTRADPYRMNSISELNTAESICERAVRSFGATTICTPESNPKKRSREDRDSLLGQVSPTLTN